LAWRGGPTLESISLDLSAGRLTSSALLEAKTFRYRASGGIFVNDLGTESWSNMIGLVMANPLAKERMPELMTNYLPVRATLGKRKIEMTTESSLRLPLLW